jgi:hypothetical protein
MDARTRLQKQVEDARKALESPAPNPTSDTTADDEAAAAEAARLAAEEAGKGAAPVPSNAEPIPATPATDTALQAENASLKAEVTRLTHALDEENNPTWKQRYSSLQGMFNHQVEELKSIKAEIAELKAKPATPAAPATPDPADTAEYDSLVEEVGEKAAKIILKNREESDRKLKEAMEGVHTDLAAAKGDAKTAAEKAAALEQGTAQERFLSTLDTKAPGWRELHGSISGVTAEGIPMNPKFAEFLFQKAAGTGGRTYNDLLNAHYADGNTDGLAEIFDLGRKFVGEPAPAVVEDPPLTPSQRAAALVEPGKTASSTKEPDNKPEMIKESERNAFHDSVKRRTFKGTSAEMAAQMAKYKLAGVEGRILYGQ